MTPEFRRILYTWQVWQGGGVGAVRARQAAGGVAVWLCVFARARECARCVCLRVCVRCVCV